MHDLSSLLGVDQTVCEMNTIELPDELMREMRARAKREGRRLADLVADLLNTALHSPVRKGGLRLKCGELPLVECKHPTPSGDEMTPDRVSEALWGPEE